MADLREALEKIMERVEKASTGPWLRDPCSSPTVQVIAHRNEVIAYHRRHERQIDSQVIPNFDFMAGSRELVPALIKACEILAADLEWRVGVAETAQFHWVNSSIHEKATCSECKARAALSAAAEALEGKGDE